MTRDLAAATLVVGGIGAASIGAAQILPAAGYIVLGLLLLVLGVALGFGDIGDVGVVEQERTVDRFTEGEPVVPPTSSAPTPAPTGPSAVEVPVDRYIGVRQPRAFEVVPDVPIDRTKEVG